jgi:hypothetical protein
MASTIECPKCRHQFDPGEAFSKNIKEDLRKQFEAERSALLQNLELQRDTLEKQQQEFEAKRLQMNELFAEKVKQEREKITVETDKRLREDYEARLESLEAEKQQKTQQLHEFERRQLDLMREKSELEEKQKNFDLEVEKKFFEKREEMESQIMSREKELFDLRMKEKETQMESLRRTIEELKRKSEQGSVQLQGEAQELLFPFDLIEEVPKGVEGADCMQVVRNTHGKECGRIIYESKRTKNWHNEWIGKLKADMRSCGADAAILVTQAFPKDMERFGERDGVWVCSYADVASVAAVLRGAIMRVADARKSEENKGEKMQMLYDFLTGNEFRQQVEAIVEGFMALKQAIAKERMQMEKLWKEREKQLEKVMLSTSGMYGSIKGIAGASVGDIPLLDGSGELLPEEMN